MEGRKYQEILNTVYTSSLYDLRKISKEKLLVDAEVAWGLRYKEISYIDWYGPVFYTILDLDLNRRNLYFQPVLARGQVPGVESLEAIVRKTGALAGINGGYFDSTRPLWPALYRSYISFRTGERPDYPSGGGR